MQAVVERLAVEFGFSVEEGMECLKRKVKVPFVRALAGKCDGLKMNGGLFTQCENKPMATGALCKTCQKQADGSGKPTCGLASEREAEGEAWRDPKGRMPTAFGKVMQKEGMNQEVVERELTRLFGKGDYSVFFVVPTKATKKAAAASGEKKQRGRPKKSKEVVKMNEGDDLIGTLIAQARAESEGQVEPVAAEAVVEEPKKAKKTSAEKEAAKAAKAAEKEAAKAAKAAEKQAKAAEKKPKKETVAVVEEVTEELVAESPVSEVQARKVMLGGVEYYMDEENNVYDVTTQEPIGVWNEATGTIEEDSE